MSEIQDRGRRLLDKLNGVNLQVMQEKSRMQSAFEERVALGEDERKAVVTRVQRLRPAVMAGTATETMEVEYTLGLERLNQLDEERFDLREAVAQLNLPGEELILKRRAELNGESTFVDD